MVASAPGMNARSGGGAPAAGYRILEQKVESARPGRVCEDMVFDLGAFLLVLDGVSPKDARLFEGRTSGRFAAERIGEAFAALPADIDALSAIAKVSRRLKRDIEAAAGSSGVPRPPGAQLAAYSVARREIWQVGDVRVRVGSRVLEHLAPPTDRVAGEFRAALLHTLLLAGGDVDEIRAADPTRQMILQLLERQDALANLADPHPLGYGVMNGTPVPRRSVRVTSVAPGTTVVFATDGYLSVPATLAAAEAELVEAEQRDPLLFQHHQCLRPVPPDGWFDDRAWVRFQTSPS